MAYERKTLDILISEELRDLLTQIEGDSEVAKLLLKRRHRKEDLVDSPVNYISLSSEDKGKIAYLTEDRIAKLDEDSYWTSPSRYKSKPGGFISKLFKNVNSKEVERFSNLFKAMTNKPKFKLELVSGSRIKELYHESTYASEERGSLGASCMKHDSSQRLFGIYTDNEEVSMLAMFDENDSLIGRALLWDFDVNDVKHKIMDRIYAKNDEELSFYFKQWATENGYLYKSEQNWYNTLYFENLNTKSEELFLEIKIGNMPRLFPYIDTFKFLNLESNTISNFLKPETSAVMTCTSGDCNSSDSLTFDSIDRVYTYSGESVYLSYRDIHTSRDNTYYSRYNDVYIAKDDCEWDSVIEDYIYIEKYASFNSDAVSERREYVLKRREEERLEEERFKSEIKEVREEEVTIDVAPNYYNYYNSHRSEIEDVLSDMLIDEVTTDTYTGEATRFRRYVEAPRSWFDISRDELPF